MKITYTYIPLGETIAVPVLLCPGDPTGSPDQWLPSMEGVLQPAGYPRAQEIEMFGRGNTIVQRPFTVHRTFNNRALALGHAFSLEALPGTVGTLKMENEGQAGGVWHAQVGCQRAEIIADIGVTLICSFLFIGPRAIQGPPNTGQN